MPVSHPTERDHWDPVFLHARREALLILAVWAVCLVWAVGGSVYSGYEQGADDVATILGIPRWVFLAIVVPWLLSNVFAAWFSFAYMAKDDLGTAHEGLDLAEELEQGSAAAERHDA